MSDEMRPLTAEFLEGLEEGAQSVMDGGYPLVSKECLLRLIATIRAAWKEREEDRERKEAVEREFARLHGRIDDLTRDNNTLKAQLASPREVMPDYEVSLWDQLTAAALTGVVARGDIAPQDGFSTYQDAAQEALAYADAVLAERKRREAGR